MHRLLPTALVLAAITSAGADEPKIPLKTDSGAVVYVAPKIDPTEKSADTRGATLGVQRPDGTSAYGGVDTAGARPTYSLGGGTGGDVSFSAGVESDGKQNKGVKAGVTIKY